MSTHKWLSKWFATKMSIIDLVTSPDFTFPELTDLFFYFIFFLNNVININYFYYRHYNYPSVIDINLNIRYQKMYVHAMTCLGYILSGMSIHAMVQVHWSHFPGVCTIMMCTLWCQHNPPAAGPGPPWIQSRREGFHIGKPPGGIWVKISSGHGMNIYDIPSEQETIFPLHWESAEESTKGGTYLDLDDVSPLGNTVSNLAHINWIIITFATCSLINVVGVLPRLKQQFKKTLVFEQHVATSKFRSLGNVLHT